MTLKKKKELLSFETSGNSHTKTQQHIPEDLSFQQYGFQNPKSPKKEGYWKA